MNAPLASEVFELLEAGPQTDVALATALALTPLEVRLLVEELRQGGYLIVEDERGLFIATIAAEFLKFQAELLLPALQHAVRAVNALRRTAAQQFALEYSEIVLGERTMRRRTGITIAEAA